MKNIAISIFLFIYTSLVFSQDTLNTSSISTHKEVRGSKIKMIPPDGFLVASNFKGFQDAASNASIMILDTPRSYSETCQGLSVESLAKQNVKVISIQEIIFNKKPATFIEAEQTVEELLLTKYIFVLGTDKESILINGLAPQNNFVLKNAIKKAILSSIYDADKILVPLDAVDFEINTKDSGFSLAKISPNMLIYSRDGKLPTESNDKTSIVVAKTFSKLEIKDKKSFALNKIKTLPLQISAVTSIVPIAIGGLKGYELLAKGINRKTGKHEQAYQVLLFNEEGYYIIYGSAEDLFNSHLALFRKIALTFKLK